MLQSSLNAVNAVRVLIEADSEPAADVLMVDVEVAEANARRLQLEEAQIHWRDGNHTHGGSSAFFLRAVHRIALVGVVIDPVVESFIQSNKLLPRLFSNRPRAPTLRQRQRCRPPWQRAALR